MAGGGGGVGRATARRFAREGAGVVLFSRTPGTLNETATDIAHEGGQVLSLVGDVSREEDVRALFQRAMDTYGRVDILVNCAGIFLGRPFVDMDAETWDRVIAVNLRGRFLCCRESFCIM